jgi:hypothetical protein
VLAVSPLAREAIIALTASELPEGERRSIRRVLLDQLKPLPDAPFYLPEPADDRVAQIDAMLPRGDRHDVPAVAGAAAAASRHAPPGERDAGDHGGP